MCGLSHRATASFSLFFACTTLVLVSVDRAAFTPAPAGCRRLCGRSVRLTSRRTVSLRVRASAATSRVDEGNYGCARSGYCWCVGCPDLRVAIACVRACSCVLACRSSVAAAATPPHRSVVVGVWRPFIIGVLALLLLWLQAVETLWTRRLWRLLCWQRSRQAAAEQSTSAFSACWAVASLDTFSRFAQAGASAP
jgi:hypothetical protein